MGLLSIFKRQAERGGSAMVMNATSESGDEVQRARTRARRRLIGAAVLLGLGIVGFPLVFETQPRPIPVNIPIETPPKEGAPALTMPAARPAPTTSASSATTTTAATPALATPKPAPAPAAEVVTESREEAGRAVAGAAPTASTPAAPTHPASKPAAALPKPAVEAKPAPTKPVVAEAKPAEPRPASNDSARARALLEGKPDTGAADSGRFVVQVGAFADVAAARETRAKVEKLGLKTYTQLASTSAGNRIRVRAGPFNSRAEADKAMAKARAAGLTAVVLTL